MFFIKNIFLLKFIKIIYNKHKRKILKLIIYLKTKFIIMKMLKLWKNRINRWGGNQL